MRGALVIALCATGCFSDHGVAIEVDIGDTKATSVELFIGKEECVQETAPEGVRCDEGIAPMGITNLLPGKVFFSDVLAGDNALPDDKVLVNSSHTVTFQLKSDQPVTLRRVIAVGLDKGMQPIATATLSELEIPTNSARVATTTLFHANPVQPKQADTEDRVMVWPNAGSPSSCVVVEHWLNGQPKRDFVVPANDPDCDGVITPRLECNANVYNSMYTSGQAPTPDCFGKGPLVGTCLLGSYTCIDGSGPMTGTCAPQSPQHDQGPVCVPSEFCSSSCTNLDPMCPLGVIDDGGSMVPRIECQFPTTSDGNRCPNNNVGIINLDVVYPLNTQCDQQPLLGSLQFAVLPTSQSHHFGEAEMELGSQMGRCNFEITWNGGARPLTDNHGVIQLQTGNRSALLPIVFQFSSGCPSSPGPVTCMPRGDMTALDPLWTCAHAP